MTDLTHEVRTPLAIVSGNLQRMASAERSPRTAVNIKDLIPLLTRLEVDPGCGLRYVDHLLVLDLFVRRCLAFRISTV